jgi:branched-chain amino acid transport system ATP-binding protein
MFFELKSLFVHYEKIEALKGVSLVSEEGLVIAIMGANGAGKSTILKAIFGLKRPSGGEVWFRNQRIDGKSPRQIARLGIGYVPEGKRLFLQMTVLENLLMGAYLRKDKREVNEDIDHVYERFPILKQRRYQLSRNLSGGEQQMLATGRALMARPRLLLMDEPTLGLSPIMVQEIARIIRDINKEGVSIILVEQNARLALSVAHKGYVLETGSIVLQGSSQELAHSEHIKRAYLGG